MAEIEDDSVGGLSARVVAGEYLASHGRSEFNIPGITFGTRYDSSCMVVPDSTQAPEDAANVYQPTAKPGGRAPHFWLTEGLSLYDTFGFEWTLLNFGLNDTHAVQWAQSAQNRGMPLTVKSFQLQALHDLYAADWVLIRPDQVVAARGDIHSDFEAVLAKLLGE